MSEHTLNFIEAPPTNNQKPTKLVIFLHGYGSNREDLMSLRADFVDLLPDAQFISVNAPDKFEGENGMNAFQWFSLKVISYFFIKPKILHAHKILDKFIDDQLERLELENKDLILIGFSQGAMMALYTGLQREEAIAGLIAFSGALAFSTPALKKRLKSKPKTLLIHGLDDEVVPYVYFRHAKKLLKRFEVPFEEYSIKGMGHHISYEAVDKTREFIKNL